MRIPTLPPSRRLPAGYTLEQDLHGGYFRLRGTCPSGEHLCITCNVPAAKWFPGHLRRSGMGISSRKDEFGSNADDAGDTNDLGKQRRPKWSAPRAGDAVTRWPLRFHALVHRIAMSSAGSSRFGSCNALLMMCACQAGTLAVDTVVPLAYSAQDLTANLDQVGDLEVLRRTYFGPTWNQRRLAELKCGGEFLGPSPLMNGFRGTATDTQCSGSTRFELDAETIYDKFGHLPVNTVQPALYDALIAHLETSCGLDDNLASLIEDIAEELQAEALRHWRKTCRAALFDS